MNPGVLAIDALPCTFIAKVGLLVAVTVKLLSCRPASTHLFQVPAEEVIAHMWRHTLFQCEAFFPTVLRVVQQPIAVAAPSKRKSMSAVESTASAPKKRRSSGPQIADSNIPTLTVAGVHIVCRNNLHGAAARQLQSMPMTLWESLAAQLLVIPHPDICIIILHASQNFCRFISAFVLACSALPVAGTLSRHVCLWSTGSTTSAASVAGAAVARSAPMHR